MEDDEGRRGGGQGEYPRSTLVRLVRRARLVEIHEAPSALMPFSLCVFVCVCARACVCVCVSLRACVLTVTSTPKGRAGKTGLHTGDRGLWRARYLPALCAAAR